MKELKSRAIQLRLAYGLSYGRLGKAVGITASHLSKFEKGYAGLSPDNLLKLARFYGVTMDYLYGSDVLQL